MPDGLRAGRRRGHRPWPFAAVLRRRTARGRGDGAAGVFFQYDGCALEKLYYEQELCDAEADGYLENGRGATNGATKENTLVLLADFSVGPEPREDGFSPDSRHERWKFILIRSDADSPWTIDDRGY